jgi:hypothetical protein
MEVIPEWMLPDSRRPSLDHPHPQHEREWKDWIILRDMNICRLCNKHADFVGTMDCHHITYENFGNENVEDGILLCRPCHERVTEHQRERLREKET